MRLILASASPRRRELLAAAGFEFDVDPVDVDEARGLGEPPAAYVERVAQLKAGAGAVRHPARLVLGADTAVAVGPLVLGKPVDQNDARRMLESLSGRAHEVLTGIAMAWGGAITSRVERTTVWFKALTPAEIAWYVATREPMDKAGAYAIQGLASRFIPRIDGSYSNVVGLPIAAVVELVASADAP